MAERQDPFAVLGNEPIADLITGTVPTVLQHPPRAGQRRTPLRPSERRRRGRMLHITFSKPEIVERLRALAVRWGLETSGRAPNVSKVVEHLLLSQLIRAEQGEINAPGVWR